MTSGSRAGRVFHYGGIVVGVTFLVTLVGAGILCLVAATLVPFIGLRDSAAPEPAGAARRSSQP